MDRPDELTTPVNESQKKGKKMQYEIERKWILEKLPNLSEIKHNKYTIEQYYLDKGIRIRKSGNKDFITIKSKGTHSRAEWEQEIPKWVYNNLKEASKNTISKTRYSVDMKNYKLDIDVYQANLANLITVEAEWIAQSSEVEQTIAQSKSFKLPSWIGKAKEVTEDNRYGNKQLAENGTPKD